MNDRSEIIKVAVDGYNGSVEKYSVGQSQELIRKALIEANGGSDKLNWNDVKNGKCAELFGYVEEAIRATVAQGLTGDEFFNKLVEFHDAALGDSIIFEMEDNTLYQVAEAARGTQGIRRQRIHGFTPVQIPTKLRIVRIYEELDRVLSGRVNFNHLIDQVSESFRQQLYNDIYTLWGAVTQDQLGGASYYNAGGSYNEDTLLDLIGHVEAASGGKTAIIYTTKKGARKIAPSTSLQMSSQDALNDVYHNGYIGSFYGTPVVVTPQRHKVGTSTFALDDKLITIVATDEKPIKVVREGEAISHIGDPFNNGDLTQEYIYGERYGIGFAIAGNAGIAKYSFTN